MGRTPLWRTLAGGLLGPVALTVLLLPFGLSHATSYVLLYLGVVAVLGVTLGLSSALLAAGSSFLLVDYFFVPPIHTFTIADETDLVTLLVFFATAGVVGTLGSRRRATQLRAEALAGDLRRANAELERLNREQAEAAVTAVRLAQSEQQVRVLQETESLRRELLASVSHELRTPLASLLTGTTAILSMHDLDPTVRRRLTLLEGEERRLTRLVADMLDLARIEGHALELRLRDLDLGEAIHAAVERHRISFPKRDIVTEPDSDGPLEVVADWDRLAQVLDNLIGNAERHAPVGTAIRLTVASGRRGMAVVNVIDEGPGVPPELRERIFDRFVRAAPDTTDAGGVGLGLAIVRGLVEAQAGRVWLEQESGGHFAFSLPLADVGSVASEDVHVDIPKDSDEIAQNS